MCAEYEGMILEFKIQDMEETELVQKRKSESMDLLFVGKKS